MTSVRAPIQLPTRIALFPISGVILLPCGHVPLMIFEPRYITMIDDILGQSRLIGLIQPRTQHTDPIANDVPLFDVGTLGRVVQFTDTGDGRYHIALEGISRFRLMPSQAKHDAIVQNQTYRQENVDCSPYGDDIYPTEHEEGPGRDRILALMKDYFGTHEIDADWQAIANSPYEALISSLAMSCPFEATEKQALLECRTHKDRADMLISLFKMNAEGGHSGAFKH